MGSLIHHAKHIATFGVLIGLQRIVDFLQERQFQQFIYRSRCQGLVLLLWQCREWLASVLQLLDRLAELAGLSEEIVTPLIKTVGISILVRIAAQICRDGGMGSIAAALELAGSLAALVTVMPLLWAVLELVGSLL